MSEWKELTDPELLEEFDNLLRTHNEISREITNAIQYMQKYSGVDSKADNTDELDALEEEQRQNSQRFEIVCDSLRERGYEWSDLDNYWIHSSPQA